MAPVITEPVQSVTARLYAAPLEWKLCATSTYEHYRAVRECAYSIRRHMRQGFRQRDHPNFFGRFEAEVLSATSTRDDRSADVELWLRWVPNDSR